MPNFEENIEQNKNCVEADVLAKSHKTSSSSSLKCYVLFLANCQLCFALMQLVENSVILFHNLSTFHYAESRLAIQFIWAIYSIWLLTVCLLLYGVLANHLACLLPNIFFSIFLVAVMLPAFMVLLASVSYTISIVMCALTIIILTLSIFYEWKYMKRIQSESLL
uniref:Uncharacterized protein n=1 Tax=Ditylenchus dipsaci TaxID=166011 RepID=A0A915EWL4_9BILA